MYSAGDASNDSEDGQALRKTITDSLKNNLLDSSVINNLRLGCEQGRAIPDEELILLFTKLEKNKDWSVIAELYDQGIILKSESLNKTLHVILGKAFLALERHDDIITLYDNLTIAGTVPLETLSPTFIHCLLEAYGKIGKYSAAINLCLENWNKSFFVSEKIFALILKLCGESGALLEAVDICKRARSNGITVGLETYETLLDLAIKNNKKKWFDILVYTLRSSNAEFSHSTYALFIHGYFKFDEHPKVLQYFEIAMAQKIPLPSFAYQDAILSCLHVNRPDRALSLLESFIPIDDRRFVETFLTQTRNLFDSTVVLRRIVFRLEELKYKIGREFLFLTKHPRYLEKTGSLLDRIMYFDFLLNRDDNSELLNPSILVYEEILSIYLSPENHDIFFSDVRVFMILLASICNIGNVDEFSRTIRAAISLEEAKLLSSSVIEFVLRETYNSSNFEMASIFIKILEENELSSRLSSKSWNYYLGCLLSSDNVSTTKEILSNFKDHDQLHDEDFLGSMVSHMIANGNHSKALSILKSDVFRPIKLPFQIHSELFNTFLERNDFNEASIIWGLVPDKDDRKLLTLRLTRAFMNCSEFTTIKKMYREVKEFPEFIHNFRLYESIICRLESLAKSMEEFEWLLEIGNDVLLAPDSSFPLPKKQDMLTLISEIFFSKRKFDLCLEVISSIQDANLQKTSRCTPSESTFAYGILGAVMQENLDLAIDLYDHMEQLYDPKQCTVFLEDFMKRNIRAHPEAIHAFLLLMKDGLRVD